MSSDLIALRQRVRAATGPDREIDAALARAFTGGLGGWNYTASIDSALALVERVFPGSCVGLIGPRKYIHIPTPVPDKWSAEIGARRASWGPTAPLAIFDAALAALLDKAERG